MEYQSKDFTYGMEIEWADVDARTKLPKYASWNKKEWTIANSDGRANDPTLKRNTFGGEINTSPTPDLENQVAIAEELITLLKPNTSYRCGLQTHIGVPGLKDDIDGLQRLFEFIQNEQDFVFFDLLPRDKPTRGEYPDDDDWKLAKRFNNQRNLWSKRGVPPIRVERIITATTPQEFYDYHFNFNTKTQKYQYHFAIHRAGINIRSLFSHGTIEFRCFPGTTNIKEIESCLRFSRQFVVIGLLEADKDIKRVLLRESIDYTKLQFPKWPTFDPKLERIFFKSAKRPDGV